MILMPSPCRDAQEVAISQAELLEIAGMRNTIRQMEEMLAQKEQAVIARLEAGIHSESGHLSAYLQTDFRRGARITKLIIR